MSGATTLERLIDDLRAAFVTAAAIERQAHDLSDSLKRAAVSADDLGKPKYDAGGPVAGPDPRD